MTDLQAILNTIHARDDKPGDPQAMHETMHLIEADPNWFGLAVVTCEGEVVQVGDCAQIFPLQSMSKAFSYALALEDHGREYLLKRVGVEPTGRRYNAIVLDESTGRPYNPMVNAGAIAIADTFGGDELPDKLSRTIKRISRFAGRTLLVDSTTFTYEWQHGHHNRAIAHLMRASGMIHGDIDDALYLYLQHCALLVNVVELAHMAATLANQGVHPITGERALQATYTRDVLSVMYTCGMYDSSGTWAYQVGLPAKSGISGGIFAVVPGKMGIASFSPPLDRNGHSIRGLHAFRTLSDQLGLHIFSDIV